MAGEQQYIRERFQSLETRLERMDEKLDELAEFRFSLLASSRLVSILVSAAFGIATMIGTVALERYIK